MEEKMVGDNWVRNKESHLLKVPSAAVIGENNILINPNHNEFEKVLFQIESFPFDQRIFQ